jgi:cytoskeletal protein CcmA (bactofilin family)
MYEEEVNPMTRIRYAMTIATMAAVWVLLTAAPVLAFDAREGDTVAVGPGEVINEDLYLAGRTVTSNGVVNADIFAAGQTVTVGGQIANGATLAGQMIMLNADVGHGARLGGANIDVSGTIGRDLMAAGATVTIAEGAVVKGDLVCGAGTAFIRGDVKGDVWGGAEELIIEGSVGGNVNVGVSTLTIRPGATIAGNLNYAAPSESTIPAGAVKGTVTFTQQVQDQAEEGARRGLGALAPLAFFAGITWKVIAYLMAFITGLVLIVISPRRMSGAAASIRNETGAAAGYGALALFVVPIAAIVVCITIIGTPLGAISLLLWGILLYLSQLPVALFFGHLVLGRNKPLEGNGFMIGALALGLLLLTLVRAIPLVGLFVGLAMALFGMGAFVVGERRLRENR